jgi:hypothetical protein
VADQQLNSRLGVIEPSRVCPQRRREVLDTGSKSVLPSTGSTTPTCWLNSARSPAGE